MNDVIPTIDRYVASWNETDPARRRALIAQTWTEDARYLDPVLSGDGHDGIDAMIARFQAAYAGNQVRRTSDVDAHHDRVRFGFEIGPDGGPALAGGLDIGELAGDRLRSITGFLDFAPAPAGQ